MRIVTPMPAPSRAGFSVRALPNIRRTPATASTAAIPRASWSAQRAPSTVPTAATTCARPKIAISGTTGWTARSEARSAVFATTDPRVTMSRATDTPNAPAASTSPPNSMIPTATTRPAMLVPLSGL